MLKFVGDSQWFNCACELESTFTMVYTVPRCNMALPPTNSLLACPSEVKRSVRMKHLIRVAMPNVKFRCAEVLLVFVFVMIALGVFTLRWGDDITSAELPHHSSGGSYQRMEKVYLPSSPFYQPMATNQNQWIVSSLSSKGIKENLSQIMSLCNLPEWNVVIVVLNSAEDGTDNKDIPLLVGNCVFLDRNKQDQLGFKTFMIATG